MWTQQSKFYRKIKSSVSFIGETLTPDNPSSIRKEEFLTNGYNPALFIMMDIPKIHAHLFV